MFGGFATGRNTVAVQIENFPFANQVTKTRFFSRFTQGHAGQIDVAIGVPAKLQPTIQFPVMRQQHPLPVSAHQPGRSREMAGRVMALEDVI